jgi:hypothetical protein
MTDGCVPATVRELSRAARRRDIAVDANTGSVSESTDPVHDQSVSVRVVRPSVLGPSPYSTAAM